MRRVILESPYRAETAGDVVANTAYARRCMQDALARDEAPLASHLLYTQVLDDTLPGERRRGMLAGFAWIDVAEAMIVYADHGISDGMRRGMAIARAAGIPIEYRLLDEPTAASLGGCFEDVDLTLRESKGEKA